MTTEVVATEKVTTSTARNIDLSAEDLGMRESVVRGEGRLKTGDQFLITEGGDLNTDCHTFSFSTWASR